MTDTDLQFFDVGVGSARRRIAYLREARKTSDYCGLMWLAGFKSDMRSTKATELANYCKSIKTEFVRFDYSGHGDSEGDFDQGTIGIWLEEAEAVFTQLTEGQQILIGSSMGGYIALLLLRRLKKYKPAEAKRISGLILIAPAWDMTEELIWKKLSNVEKEKLIDNGYILKASEYSEPYKFTRQLIEEGRQHLLLGKPFNPERPLFIIHGLKDTSVPPCHVEKLRSLLLGDWIKIIQISDGEHRLSRPQDLEILFEAIAKISILISQMK